MFEFSAPLVVLPRVFDHLAEGLKFFAGLNYRAPTQAPSVRSPSIRTPSGEPDGGMQPSGFLWIFPVDPTPSGIPLLDAIGILRSPSASPIAGLFSTHLKPRGEFGIGPGAIVIECSRVWAVSDSIVSRHHFSSYGAVFM